MFHLLAFFLLLGFFFNIPWVSDLKKKKKKKENKEVMLYGMCIS